MVLLNKSLALKSCFFVIHMQDNRCFKLGYLSKFSITVAFNEKKLTIIQAEADLIRIIGIIVKTAGSR